MNNNHISKKKIKSCAEVVQDFYDDAKKSIKGFDNRLQDAKDRFWKKKEQYEKSGYKFDLPSGYSFVPIDQVYFNYGVQRDLNVNHVCRIMDNFDPRVARQGCAVKKDDKYYVFDSQHTLVAMTVLLDVKELPMSWVETHEEAFDAVAFDKLNNTGIMKADKGAIHNTYLYRYKHGDRSPEVVDANIVQEVFDEAGVNLESRAVAQSVAKRGPHQHTMSHFLYAYQGLKMTNKEALKDILAGIKKHYPNPHDNGSINQGFFIGLAKIFQQGKEANSLDFFPDNWVDLLLESVVKKCGTNGDDIHSGLKKQWQHTRGTSWDAPVAMATFLREVFMLQDKTVRMQFNVPAIEKSYVLYNREGHIDIKDEFKPFFRNEKTLQIV